MGESTSVHVRYTSQLFEEDGQIVAICPELGVSSFGDSLDEALAALHEAVSLFLEECQRMGTLEAVLEEAGYRRVPETPERWERREPITDLAVRGRACLEAGGPTSDLPPFQGQAV